MASTYAQADAALRDYGVVFGRAQDEKYTILEKFKAIDISSPTALEQINALDAEYTSKRDGWNSDKTESKAILEGIYNNLPPDGFFSNDKANFRKTIDATVTQYNALTVQGNTIRDEMRAAKAKLEKAAAEKTASAAPEKPPAEPPSVSTNDDAKKSGSTSSGNTSGITNASSDDNIYTENVKYNPLSELSSYTYNIVLYMVDQTVMNNFIAGGGTMKGITSSTPGVIVVAKTGGITAGDDVVTDWKGNKLDYYIDDFVLTTFFPGGHNRATAATEIKFKIIEPYGFGFLQNLTKAGLKLHENGDDIAKNMVGIRQHYIIGINFRGYDGDGKIINTTTIPSRHFAIKITKLKFKLDGKAVTYNCDAVVLSEAIANGQIHGIIPASASLVGSTIYEVLANPKNDKSLVSILNGLGETNKDNNQLVKPAKYSIEFLDKNKNVVVGGQIDKKNLISDEQFDQKMAVTFNARSRESVTIASQLGATQYDGKSAIQLTAGQTILTVIDNIITKSEYVSEALDRISTASTESRVLNNPVRKKLAWFSVNPVISIMGTDPIRKDWAYEVKYQIQPYEVPYIRLATADSVSAYQGPFKKYEYWLTGMNSEILSYEQQYDNLYYVTTVMAQNKILEGQTGNTGEAPQNPQNAQGQSSVGTEGRNLQYNQNAAAQIYSPGDSARAKIRIIGDPDYIVTTVGVNLKKNDAAEIDQSNSFRLSPLDGQKFIEINFGMASDYKDDGLMDISGAIQFYGNSTIKEKMKIKGVVYRVIRVDSTFSKGVFSQVLDLVLVDQTVLVLPSDAGAGVIDGIDTRTSEYRKEDYDNQGRTSTQPYNSNPIPRHPVNLMPNSEFFDKLTNQATDNMLRDNLGQIRQGAPTPFDDAVLNVLKVAPPVDSSRTGK